MGRGQSEIKWLVNPQIKEISNNSHRGHDINQYIEHIYFYKTGECGIGCCYIKFGEEYDASISETVVGRTQFHLGGDKEDEDKIRPFLFDTKEEAIIAAIIMIEEIIVEYEKRISNLRKLKSNSAKGIKRIDF